MPLHSFTLTTDALLGASSRERGVYREAEGLGERGLARPASCCQLKENTSFFPVVAVVSQGVGASTV